MDIKAKILALIGTFAAPNKIMWNGPDPDGSYPNGYEDGYNAGYDDAVAEILRAVDEMEVSDDA